MRVEQQKIFDPSFRSYLLYCFNEQTIQKLLNLPGVKHDWDKLQFVTQEMRCTSEVVEDF